MPRFIGRHVDGLNHLTHMSATRGRRILRIGNNMTWSSVNRAPNFYFNTRKRRCRFYTLVLVHGRPDQPQIGHQIISLFLIQYLRSLLSYTFTPIKPYNYDLYNLNSYKTVHRHTNHCQGGLLIFILVPILLTFSNMSLFLFSYITTLEDLFLLPVLHVISNKVDTCSAHASTVFRKIKCQKKQSVYRFFFN